MTDVPLWRARNRVIVVDCATTSTPRLLVVPAQPIPGGATLSAVSAVPTWQLPEWTVDEPREHDTNPDRIARQVQERLGLAVSMLRCLEPTEDEATRTCSGTWVLERRKPSAPAAARLDPISAYDSIPSSDLLQGSSAAPPTLRWITLADMTAVSQHASSDSDAHRGWALATSVLRDVEQRFTPPGRRAWSEPGWLAVAEAWITDQLHALGRPLASPIAQHRNNSISCVLRAPTARGDVYFKAASPHFKEEARLTRALAKRFPDHLPHVLASDPGRSWLLLEDFGPGLRSAPISAWEETLQILGEMQRRCVSETQWLTSIGCADRRLNRLRRQVPAFVHAPETRAEMDEPLHAALVARIPQLQAACDELAACGLPETLIHGDLHGGNVAWRDGHVTIFDWTDAAIAHPLLDLVTFLPTERRKPVDVQDHTAAAERLLDCYLEGWTGYAGPRQLRRAVDLLKTIGQLHQALSYLQILRSLEPADYWQWQGELAEWLTPVASPGAEMKDIFPA